MPALFLRMAALVMGGTRLLLAQENPLAPPLGPRDCRLLMEAKTGQILLRQGPCEIRHSPCSTFKIPLAVMGFDSGILISAHQPAWDYDASYPSTRPEEQTRLDPTSWEKISSVWYSQKLTGQLGLPAFRRYVDQFPYGNRDLSGDPGQDNGLTHAWLMSSLLISPDEQAAFLQKLLSGGIGVSPQATALTQKILPVFPAEDGWTVTGKTGSGFQRQPDGTLDRSLALGWFVGWAHKAGRTVIFTNLLLDESPQPGYGGLRCRDAFLKALPMLVKER